MNEGLAGSPLVTLLALAALGLLPFAFMIATSFVKIAVVLGIVRSALGTGQVPSGTVITALAAILSLYVMAPTFHAMAVAAAPRLEAVDRRDPLAGPSGEALFEAARAGAEPMRDFLARHAGPRETEMFLSLARQARPADRAAEVGARDWMVLLPAFLVTELSEAFQIGFLVFIPFLVVDMVVANVLLALGMHMLSPTTVSLPFKLLLFVLADGWYVLARALVLGYA
ncbi:MAG: type III secretion system export apparatus subunit SctR [Myxococcota bacterium]|nr:type III secretion system export apparatus subunit SctR [Myxococcota bacterium]MDW8362765.1 type III secretion system export apparatus subunit SctR [Myxococcales bacterium]